MSVRRMVNPVMAYAWGSHDGIAQVQGRQPGTQPEAELWMGAHPHAPSLLESAQGEREPLDAAIAADPVAVLGADCVDTFGPRLPFLLKVLSARRPLSLQVHPNDVQARRGFAAEDAAGIDRDAPQRSYRDPYAKPEMLVAVTDFHVLQGFRPAAAAASALEALGIARLAPLIEALRNGTPTGEVFLRLIEWPVADRAALVADACLNLPADGIGPWMAELAAEYPADPGVVGVLLLNYFVLRRNQGLFVRPGQIHAYLLGTGIEILGGSDNVIRCGLTPKYVSVPDLRVILDVEAAAPVVVDPVPTSDGGERWPTDQPEFALSCAHFDGVTRTMHATGPVVAFCLDGELAMSERGSAPVTVRRGESVFVTAGATLDVAGRGALMVASAGLAQVA